MIRPITPEDREAVLALIEASGLFLPDELGELDTLLFEYFGSLQEGDQFWCVNETDGQICGVAYYAPERMTSGTWNVYLIAVHPDFQGQGHGTALMGHIEAALASRGERLLLVETAGLESFERTRTFYRSCGYEEEARIRDFYAEGEDKIIFRKPLSRWPLSGRRQIESLPD